MKQLVRISFKKLLCPICVISILAGITLYNFIEILTPQNRYKIHFSIDNTTDKVDQYISQCKDGYWFSLIVFDEEVNTYRFVDVRGYNPYSTGENKVFSVKAKRLNLAYWKSHPVDYKTRVWINSFDTGLVGFYEDLEMLKLLSQTIYSAITKEPNLKLFSAGLGVVKDPKHNLVYMLVVTSSNKILSKCNKNDLAKIIQGLSIIFKNNLAFHARDSKSY